VVSTTQATVEKLASDVVEAASRLDNVFEDVKLSVDEETEYSVSRPLPPSARNASTPSLAHYQFLWPPETLPTL
jgi:hypothetical protein